VHKHVENWLEANVEKVLVQTTPFTATRTYSDSSTQDLTSPVSRSSGTPSVATITAAGLASAVGTQHLDHLGETHRRH
jgi:hypothetical protein